MKIRIAIIAISIITAFVFLSAGYSLWEKKLVIKGHITVIRPEAKTSTIPKIQPSTDNNDLPKTSPDAAGSIEETPSFEPVTSEDSDIVPDNPAISGQQDNTSLTSGHHDGTTGSSLLIEQPADISDINGAIEYSENLPAESPNAVENIVENDVKNLEISDRGQ